MFSQGDQWGSPQGLTTGVLIETEDVSAYRNQHSDLGGHVPELLRVNPGWEVCSPAKIIHALSSYRARWAFLPNLSFQPVSHTGHGTHSTALPGQGSR